MVFFLFVWANLGNVGFVYFSSGRRVPARDPGIFVKF